MSRYSSVFFKSLFLLGINLSAGAQASTTVQTRIHDLITPTAPGESARILSTTDGRVYEVDSSRVAVMASLLRAQATHASLQLTLDASEHVIAAMEAIESSAPVDETTVATPGYQPSQFSSLSDAQSLFDSLPQLRHKSQCYQRAHVWAYQMYSERSVHSMKVFLFFTREFIQEHHYKWWFHVAPFVYVQGQEIVLDPEFVQAPLAMHDWTNYFMMDQNFVSPPLTRGPDCTEVKSYTDYSEHQMSQLCYTLKLPMYFYEPKDAENLAEAGTQITSFRDWDVQNSRSALP